MSAPDPHDWRTYEGGYPWPHLDLPCRKDPERYDDVEGKFAGDGIECHRCPVMDSCLTFALEESIQHHVLGGTTSEQRRSMLRALRRRHR